ncbi:MAG: diacylglycerol kinase family protein [Candidatus Zixiibacteriota bacterium]
MRIVAIINATSSPEKQRAIIAGLRRELGEHGLTTHITAYPGHATELARQAAADHADTIVVAGGDGTIGQVVNGVIGSHAKLGLIPIGTANDLAGHFRIPASIHDACAVVREGQAQAIDVIRINGRRFVTTAGFGIGSSTIAAVQRIRNHRIGRGLARIAGSRTYALGYLVAMADHGDWPCDVRVRRSGLDMKATVLSLSISNLPRLGVGFQMTPDANASDGEFEVCLIENNGLRGAVEAAFRARRNSLSTWARVHHWRARTLVVEAERPIVAFADGELLEPQTRFEISIVRGAITLITPECDDRSQSRPSRLRVRGQDQDLTQPLTSRAQPTQKCESSSADEYMPASARQMPTSADECQLPRHLHQYLSATAHSKPETS